MRKVNADNLSNYEGKILARNVFYNGQLLFQSNSIIDTSLINRVNELKKSIPYVFIYNNDKELNGDITQIINTEIMDNIKAEVDLIFHRYSYKNEDDTELMKKIVDVFLNSILNEKYFRNYLENLIVLNNNLFTHSIRVTVISLILAIKANLNQELINGIAIGSVLHEIGRNKLYIEFPVLASENHVYNQEEYHLTQMIPVLGFNEVLNNNSVPLISKKIILMHNVWENFNASYDEKKKIYMSHPLFYEGKKITSEQKDIAVNIVQAANYFDMFLIRFKHSFSSLSANEKYNMFFIKNSENIFSKEVLKLITDYISFFSKDENVELSNGKVGRIYKQTNEPFRPIVMIDKDTLLDLTECDSSIYIKNMLVDKGSDEKVERKSSKK